jgi:hypothetical protein
VAELPNPSPRDVIRFLNLFRFHAYVAVGRGVLVDQTWPGALRPIASLAHVLIRWPELADRLTTRGPDGELGLSVLAAAAYAEQNGHAGDATWADSLVRFRLTRGQAPSPDGPCPLDDLRHFLQLHPDVGSVSKRLF